MANLSATNDSSLHNVLEYGYSSVPIIQGRLNGVYSKHPAFTIVLSIMLVYMSLVAYFRFNNVNRLKTKHGFTADARSFEKMTVEQAQEVQRNMAEWDFPALYEFGWLIEFFKTCTAPSVSKVICETGHFTNPDPLLAHARQQDTVCLMTAMTAQPLGSIFSALCLARINEHHNTYGHRINSDTVLWLLWMFMWGPTHWINRGGWRKLEPFEVHAQWVLWRELSVRMGCKWVPTYLFELQHFREQYVLQEQKPSKWNTTFSDAIMDDITYKVPSLLKPAARKCVIAVLDLDVVWANGYAAEYSSVLRQILFGILKTWGLFQRYFCLPRVWGRVLTPAQVNDNGLMNFPDYTFPNTPYYVETTFWNQWGPWAWLDILSGMPRPSAELGANGVKWESMGAKMKDPSLQLASESRVRAQAMEILRQGWGYRAKVKYQPKSLVVDKHYGPGYGSRDNAYTEKELEAKGPWK
ncbi:MAG: hypothetical protein FRX48_09439 [Lasallia pustulata]|uniref:Uncharacterized protein n=1 Tax=Lasallia pustulata TaxID=136370 RepID=A0A5M8PCJ6_9LECA|nr:MAG: hypothetical protein FRX48_09439 [Lasallia pustulata]